MAFRIVWYGIARTPRREVPYFHPSSPWTTATRRIPFGVANRGLLPGAASLPRKPRTTVDPTVGVGLRATFYNHSPGVFWHPPITIGANAERTFRPGSVVPPQA